MGFIDENKITDTAAGMPITPATAAAASLSLIGRKGDPPMACCPKDGEPLISTLKYPGAEFVCMVCAGLFGFLSPTPKTETPELTARYNELKAAWDQGMKPGTV